MKQQTCKFEIGNDGTICGSPFHTAMYHKPMTPIKRTAIQQKTLLEFVNDPKKIERAAKRSMEKRNIFIKKSLKNKTVSRLQLVKKLDSIFSQYIRQKYAIDGMTACVTCGVVKRWQDQQNGHYMSRGHLPTRWDETNCFPQCAACNIFKKGNYTEYALFMIDKFGADYLIELKSKARSNIKITSIEIQEMIEKYTLLIK